MNTTEDERIFDAVVRLLGEKGHGDYAALVWQDRGIDSAHLTTYTPSLIHVAKLRPIGKASSFDTLGSVEGGATLCGITPYGHPFSDVKLLALVRHDGVPLRPTCTECTEKFNE